MNCFLASNPFIVWTDNLNPANGFVFELQRCLPKDARGLYICSDPSDGAGVDEYAAIVRRAFEKSGMLFSSFETLDGRNRDAASSLVSGASFIFLTGGHVPTQNRFFQDIKLAELMASFDGIVVGLSAGSMNCASVVYAQPEEKGEAVDPEYKRFIPGLGLTDTMLLPHYESYKDFYLDGLRVYEDITYPDSMGRTFYAIPDGSYLIVDGDHEEIRGEAYRIRNGVLKKVSDLGGKLVL